MMDLVFKMMILKIKWTENLSLGVPVDKEMWEHSKSSIFSMKSIRFGMKSIRFGLLWTEVGLF